MLGWVAEQVGLHQLGCRSTLEVGSLNVNGTVRDLFTGVYLGVDMRDGPGVDTASPGLSSTRGRRSCFASRSGSGLTAGGRRLRWGWWFPARMARAR